MNKKDWTFGISKKQFIIILVLIVVAAFLLHPQWLGKGEDKITLKVPALSILQTNTMVIQTNIICTTPQECINYALQQDPTATDIEATCDKTCTFITQKTPTVEVTP